MKKLTALLTAILLLCGMSTAAFAKEVTIRTTVPKYHTVTIVAKGGSVAADGTVCGQTVQVERQKVQNWWLLPEGGKVLDKVYYNGEDVTAQVAAGVFTAPALVADAILEVIFKDTGAAAVEGYDVSGAVIDEDGNPVPGVTVDIGGNTGITDDDGNFTIEDVPPGTWPVIITDKDGNIIGIGEITIDEPGEGDLAVTVDENGNPIVTPGKDTKRIGIKLTIGEDGVIDITGVKDTTENTPAAGGGSGGSDKKSSGTDGKTPRTGDGSNPMLWFALLILSFCSVIGTVIYRRRKRCT